MGMPAMQGINAARINITPALMVTPATKPQGMREKHNLDCNSLGCPQGYTCFGGVLAAYARLKSQRRWICRDLGMPEGLHPALKYAVLYLQQRDKHDCDAVCRDRAELGVLRPHCDGDCDGCGG